MAMRKHCDQRLAALEAERLSFFYHWQEIAQFIIPRRYRWLVSPNQSNRGSPNASKIVDETATMALRVLSSGMMAGMTSPGRPWNRLSLPDMELTESSPVKVWLYEAQKRMSRVMAESNYYTVKAVQVSDLPAFGTAPMIIYEDAEDVICCHNSAAGEFYTWNDIRGFSAGLYRKITKTVQQLVDEYGIDNCSVNVRASFENGAQALHREVVVGHAIEKNDTKLGGGLVPALFPWREVYWEVGSDTACLLRSKGFHEQPFSCPRWEVSGNDAYGRSPAMEALGSVKQLQQEQRDKAMVINKGARPAMLADVTMRNEPASLLPNGVTYVANLSQSGGMRPIYEPNPAFIGMIREDIKEVQDRINRVFYVDLFMMISQMDTVRTATEIDARREEKLIQLGPVLERNQSESLDVEIERIFAIMVRRSMPHWQEGRDGLLPMPPPELQNMSLQIEYVSMLAEAQRAASTSAIERLAGFVGTLAAANPEALDNIDTDEMIDEYADLLGVAPKVVRATAEVMKLRQQRAQQQQQQAQMQQSMAAAQGAKTMSETDVGGGQNALSKMIGASGMAS